MRSLAREHGTCVPTIRATFERIGHEPRIGKAGGPRRVWTDEEVDEIVRRHRLGESQDSIAKAFTTHQSKISRLLRSRGGWDGRRRLRKGGRTTTHQGYHLVLIYATDPLAEMRNSQGYVPEHRLVMARHLGRPLERNETVHHINGNKKDNRLENLQLRRGHHGRGRKCVCADCGSENIREVEL